MDVARPAGVLGVLQGTGRRSGTDEGARGDRTVTIEAISIISTIAYFIAGMAAATTYLLVEGDEADDDPMWIFFIVLLWPCFLPCYLPLYTVRWIKARQKTSREKPHAFSEYDEP
jgi:hypothetical protein